MATAKQVKATKDFVYNPFPGADAVTVKAGEMFTIPQHWKRDEKEEKLLKLERQKKSGKIPDLMVFRYEGEIVNPNEKDVDLRERRQHMVVVPLKEV